jgi:hypothetical protein
MIFFCVFRWLTLLGLVSRETQCSYETLASAHPHEQHTFAILLEKVLSLVKR